MTKWARVVEVCNAMRVVAMEVCQFECSIWLNGGHGKERVCIAKDIEMIFNNHVKHFTVVNKEPESKMNICDILSCIVFLPRHIQYSTTPEFSSH